MKNKTMTATLAFSLLFGSVPAFADGSLSSQTTNDQGTATVSQTVQVQEVDPDSLLYSLKELLNQLKLWLTFNDTEKANLLIQQANDKVDELEVLKANGKEKYNEEYSKKINNILKETEQVLKQASVHPENIDKETQEAFTEVQKHSIAVLKSNLDKVPEPGKKGIRNAIAKQEAQLNAKMSAETVANSTLPQRVTEQSPVPTSDATVAHVSEAVDAQSEAGTAIQPEKRKAKHDNGLHLGQLKHDREKGRSEHKNK